MNIEALFIFLILLAGLVLCYLLADDIEGLTTYTSTKYTIDPNTGNYIYPTTDTLLTEAETAFQTLAFTNINLTKYNNYTYSATPLASGNTLYDLSGNTAIASSNSDGSIYLAIKLPDSNGATTIFSPHKSTDIDASSSSIAQSIVNKSNSLGNTNVYYSDYGYAVVNTNNTTKQPAVIVMTSNGVFYYDALGNGTASASGTSASGTSASASGTSGDYNNSQGIPYDQIPYGQEDLYILKTTIVPPLCPVGTDTTTQSTDDRPSSPSSFFKYL